MLSAFSRSALASLAFSSAPSPGPWALAQLLLTIPDQIQASAAVGRSLTKAVDWVASF